MADRLRWGTAALTIEIAFGDDYAPRLAAAGAGGTKLVMPAGLPLVDVLTVCHGHSPASDRLIHTSVGHGMRLIGSRESTSGEGNTESRLELELHDGDSGLTALVSLSMPQDVAAIRSIVTVRNDGTDAVVLRSVTSWSAYLGHASETAGRPADLAHWNLLHAQSDWLAEGRWSCANLRQLLPEIHEELTGHAPRGEYSLVSTGTWSTGKHLPMGVLSSEADHAAWAWQIEHNGAWRWEVGDDTADGYVALSGPTDSDHQWLRPLEPGEAFTTVPVTVALAADATAGIAELTRFRRAVRREHPDNAELSVVFNDYMNTLDGDPTTDKLLPLIDAAAAVGAEIFCVDAGWYDDSGDWWDSVGEWRPSSTRFPGGLCEVIDRIRGAGMVPGLWLEPEVIGVNSPIAATLPPEAFLSRAGHRIVEHHRYHLDLRHPAARAHLDEVIDRLVHEFGIGYFKLDYNINPGAGTDEAAPSVGAGLLEHNRAHLRWLDGVHARHPGLVLENCGSGAMRSDFAMLSRLQLQSTSDQQNFLAYPPIAASAPAQMLPEQAANWAYPQPEMTQEEVAFCLATGLLGRFFLSGYLNRMSPEQLALVREAVAVAKHAKHTVATATPFWPLGAPAWHGDWVALGLNASSGRLITVWNRSPESSETVLRLNEVAGQEIRLRTVFPTTLDPWQTTWNREEGTLHIRNLTGVAGARVFRIDTGGDNLEGAPAQQNA